MQKYMTQPFVLFSWKLMYVIYVEICGLFTGLSPIFRKTSKLSFYFYIVKNCVRYNNIYYKPPLWLVFKDVP